MLLSIQKLELKKIRFDETLEPGRLDFSNSGVSQVGPLLAEGEAELLENTDGEVRVKGYLKGLMEAECDRCLTNARFPLDERFDLFYQPNKAVEGPDEIALKEGEAEIGFYQGLGIELDELLREQVLLRLPMHLLCTEDCRGLCPVCGQNRNERDCQCQETPADDRWAGLKQFQISEEKVVK